MFYVSSTSATPPTPIQPPYIRLWLLLLLMMMIVRHSLELEPKTQQLKDFPFRRRPVLNKLTNNRHSRRLATAAAVADGSVGPVCLEKLILSTHRGPKQNNTNIATLCWLLELLTQKCSSSRRPRRPGRRPQDCRRVASTTKLTE